jgi:hypothetical protein
LVLLFALAHTSVHADTNKTDCATAINMIKGSKSMQISVEVEIDIFSGKPNPAWVLTKTEADSFVKKLSTMSRTSATKLSGNLGYRGFIVQVKQGIHTKLIHIQTGIVHISIGAMKIYAKDMDRVLERWLLHTGKPFLKDELFKIVEKEFR